MWRVFIQQNQRLHAFQSRLDPRSVWALRWAVSIALFVVILPALALLLAAFLVGLCVFILLSLVGKVMSLFDGGQSESKPTSEEIGLRRNVRVMEEE